MTLIIMIFYDLSFVIKMGWNADDADYYDSS